ARAESTSIRPPVAALNWPRSRNVSPFLPVGGALKRELSDGLASRARGLASGQKNLETPPGGLSAGLCPRKPGREARRVRGRRFTGGQGPWRLRQKRVLHI